MTDLKKKEFNKNVQSSNIYNKNWKQPKVHQQDGQISCGIFLHWILHSNGKLSEPQLHVTQRNLGNATLCENMRHQKYKQHDYFYIKVKNKQS